MANPTTQCDRAWILESVPLITYSPAHEHCSYLTFIRYQSRGGETMIVPLSARLKMKNRIRRRFQSSATELSTYLLGSGCFQSSIMAEP